MNRVFYFAVLFLIAFQTNAQQSPIQFSQLDVNNGLSHNHINSIIKDSKGYLWFATPNGLNRFDGKGVHVFTHNSKDAKSLIDDTVNELFIGPYNQLWVKTRLGFNIYDPKTESFIRNVDSVIKADIPVIDIIDIKEDNRGYFWFLYANQGLFRYDVTKQKFQKYTTQRANFRITGIRPTKDNNLWIVYEDGFLELLNTGNFQQLYSISINEYLPISKADYKVFIDSGLGIWVYAKNMPLGVYYLDTDGEKVSYFHTASSVGRLNTNFVTNITEDDLGRIWLATDPGGINVVNKNDFSITYLVNEEFDDRSLAQNSIVSLYKDRDGIIWVGSFKKGVSYFHDNVIKFSVYRHQAGNSASLFYDDINRFVEDKQGNLWIGTNGGGLIYFNRKNNTFKQYKNNPADPHSLSSDVIVSLLLDKQGMLWIGTYHGGLNKFDGNKFTHYFHDFNNPESISDNSVWELMEDSQGRIWVGTLSGGLNIMDRKSGKFKRFGYRGENSPQDSYISALMEDSEGNIWIGTANGIDILEKSTGRFKHLGHQEKDETSLSNNHVADIYQDSKGFIWIATRDGINKYIAKDDAFQAFRKEDGLPDNTILTILEDHKNSLWLSTLKGISIMRYSNEQPDQLVFRNYDKSDGLQANAFNERAAFLTRKGEVIFGGPSGFNIINPYAIKDFDSSSVPIITDFQLFNKSVKIGEKIDGQILFKESPTETRNVVLAHNQNMISIAFTSLDFLNREHTSFLYQLEGFNDNWLPADPQSNKAVFTNLDPGSYRFKVKVSENNESWSQEYTLLSIEIKPPFWQTPIAYMSYFVVLLIILLFVRHIEKQREQSRFLLRQERKEAQRIRELDRMKTRFFTNVSHEFRTPLSLIIIPLDKLIATATNDQQVNHLNLIQRNARRMLNLVNQLLDFRKIDMQELKLDSQPGDIIESIEQHFISFSDIAEKKNINYLFKQNIRKFYTNFDHDKLERILFNLLSNAFKFTPDEGTISVELDLKMNIEAEEAQLLIKVSDNGIGIPQDKQDQLFTRYFQHEMPSELLNQGSGIGLAITKEYIQLAGGEISFQSKVNQGSCFSVILPLHTINIESESPSKDKKIEENHLVKRQRILLVEDNEDFRFYLKDNLKEWYSIEEAADAELGWQKALATHPDIIVSDISMPKGNGIDLCRKLKADERTMHIPIILLTAIADESSHLRGLETGASDYIIKPFNFELLLSKIKSLLKQKTSLEKKYKKQLEVNPARIEVQSADEKFLQKALEVTESNLGNSDFTIEFLAREMCMSRVSLYKRILLLTGHTPTQFVRNMRLKRAAQLLEESQLSIAEVAYEVGFNDPKRFSRYYKEVYNILPSVYKSSNG